MKEGWEYRKLGEFIEEFSVRDKGKGYPVYSVTNTKGFCQEFFGKIVASENTSNYKVVPRGCFAYNPSRINVGSVAWQNQEENVSVSPLYVVFSVSPKLRKDYLLYYIKSNYSMTFINALSRGAVRNNLRLSTLKTFKVPYASISEQQHVVEELDLLSFIIEKKKAQLNELNNLAQSLFYEMFGSPTGNEKSFPLLTVNDVIKFEGGSQPPKTSFEYTPTPDNVRLIQIRDYKTDAYITYVPKKLARKFCEEDDIMIGRYGPPIFQILKGIRGAYNVALMKAVPLKGNKEFVRAYLKQKCLLHYLETFSRRVAGQDGIQMDKLKAYPFPYPPIELQNQFASKIEAIEHQKELIKQSIKEVETLFNSRMDYYFN